MQQAVRVIRIKKKVVILTVVAVFFFTTGFLLAEHIQQKKIESFILSFKTLREKGDTFTYISPLIGTIANPATDVGIFSHLKEHVEDYVRKQNKKGNLTEISFYFRDLNSPLWFGVHENKSFFPASLFKLPIAIAVYKQGERDPSFFEKKLVYTQELRDFNARLAGSEKSNLEVGRVYTPEELVTILLEKSDNGAKDLLMNSIDQAYLVDLFNIVSGVNPFNTGVYEISSRGYAHFLRLLYGATYLNEKNSEYLLSLLAKSEFTGGVKSGVSTSTQVANKFGVYEVADEVTGEPFIVLHDCGIVYHSDHPYIICIMTKGKNYETLLEIISTISRIVFEHQGEHDPHRAY